MADGRTKINSPGGSTNSNPRKKSDKMDDVRRQLESFRQEQKSKQEKGFQGPRIDMSGTLSPSTSSGPSSPDVCASAPWHGLVSDSRAGRALCTHPRVLLALQILVYFTLFALAVKVEFGSVYFVLSLFVLLWLSLGQRKEGEKSAYSVFNEGCERLPGQITAEQFENEIRRKNL